MSIFKSFFSKKENKVKKSKNLSVSINCRQTTSEMSVQNPDDEFRIVESEKKKRNKSFIHSSSKNNSTNGSIASSPRISAPKSSSTTKKKAFYQRQKVFHVVSGKPGKI